MIIKELREGLPEGALIFDNPSYDKSIIGVTDDGRVVYSYEKMVQELMEDDEIEDVMEAAEFIDYNTVRSLSYIADEQKPIVMYEIVDL